MSRLCRFTSRKEKRYTLNRKLDGSRGRSGCVRKISPPPIQTTLSGPPIQYILKQYEANTAGFGGWRKWVSISEAFAKPRKATTSFISVRPSARNNSSTTRRILIKFDIGIFFAKCVQKIQVPSKSEKNNWYFTCRPIDLMIVPRSFLFRIFFPQTKAVEKMKTHLLCSITFFRKSCRLWDYVANLGTTTQITDGNKIRRLRFSCWVLKATDTYTLHL